MINDNSENIMMQDSGKFDKPSEILEILTSDNIPYDKLTEFANTFMDEINPPHLTSEGHKYQCISQVILECYRLINGFESRIWYSSTKLNYKLKLGEDFITFNRINGRGEVCSYKMANFDQIDFGEELQKVIKMAKLKTNNSTYKSEEKSQHKTKEDDRIIKQIIKLIKDGKNIFITGHAGTGKSYILNRLKEIYKKKLTITSTTGIAAVNVRGQTLHSWAGIGLCRNTIENTIEKIKNRPVQYKQILNCKMLAIDEISMLNMETFEYVDAVLRKVREEDLPFGGIQVIFIGDFFQLPPVEKENSFERHYCFDSPLWQELELQNIILKKNYRQNQENFIKALSNMRTNNLTQEDAALFRTRNINSDTSQTNILHIFSTNEEANNYNYKKFNAINEPVNISLACDAVYRGKGLMYGNFTEREKNILDIFNKSCRAEKEIALKIGCKVMLLINMDFERGLINGACGTVERFNEKSVNITFDNGVNANIPVHKFEYYYNDNVLAERTQYPLKLAYGITIHKSQGMTLDKLVVDCARIFERGQVYVAMSRVRTLEGLYLKSFSPDKVLVDEKVAKFYENLEEVEDIESWQDIDFNSVKAKTNKKENTQCKYSDKEVVDIIKLCVQEFNGLYGKSGISKILTGSSAIKNNEYNEKAANSNFYGLLKGKTRKAVDLIIDSMIKSGVLKIKKVTFGRPLLYVDLK